MTFCQLHCCNILFFLFLGVNAYLKQVRAAAHCPMLFSAPLPPAVTCTQWSFMLRGLKRPPRSSETTKLLIWWLSVTRTCVKRALVLWVWLTLSFWTSRHHGRLSHMPRKPSNGRVSMEVWRLNIDKVILSTCRDTLHSSPRIFKPFFKKFF